ncbi:MAG: biotin transporter BioY [Janthinobacterium lividum]
MRIPLSQGAVRLWSIEAPFARVARSVIIVAIGSALIALAAHVQVPFWPVRLSLQSLAVMLVGIALGGRLGGLTLLAYLAEGALGLPVFQGGAGLSYMVGPTGGFLLGYLLCSTGIGYAADQGAFTRPLSAAVATAAGLLAIYLPGLIWLALLFGPGKSLEYGLYPFLPGELVKAALVLALCGAIRRAQR